MLQALENRVRARTMQAAAHKHAPRPNYFPAVVVALVLLPSIFLFYVPVVVFLNSLRAVPPPPTPLPTLIFLCRPPQGASEPARRPVLLARRGRVPLPVPEVPGADQLHADRPLPPLAEGCAGQGVAMVPRGHGAWGRRGEDPQGQEGVRGLGGGNREM